MLSFLNENYTRSILRTYQNAETIQPLRRALLWGSTFLLALQICNNPAIAGQQATAGKQTPVEARTDFGLVAGTEGGGFEVARELTSSLRLRASYSGFVDISETFDSDRATYRGDAELSSGAFVLDISPGGGSFHFSVGVVLQDHDIQGSADLESLAVREFSQDTVDQIRDLLGGADLGSVDVRADLNSIGPYAGVGFRSQRTTRGLGLSFDLGVIYFGSAEVDAALSTQLPISSVPGADFAIQTLLNQEAADLEKDLEDYELFPVVRFSVFYRF